jgi:hypothetical protein
MDYFTRLAQSTLGAAPGAPRNRPEVWPRLPSRYEAGLEANGDLAGGDAAPVEPVDATETLEDAPLARPKSPRLKPPDGTMTKLDDANQLHTESPRASVAKRTGESPAQNGEHVTFPSKDELEQSITPSDTNGEMGAHREPAPSGRWPFAPQPEPLVIVARTRERRRSDAADAIRNDDSVDGAQAAAEAPGDANEVSAGSGVRAAADAHRADAIRIVPASRITSAASPPSVVPEGAGGVRALDEPSQTGKPTIRVTIGRIDVRAVMQPPARPKHTPPPHPASQSLEDYLRGGEYPRGRKP